MHFRDESWLSWFVEFLLRSEDHGAWPDINEADGVVQDRPIYAPATLGVVLSYIACYNNKHNHVLGPSSKGLPGRMYAGRMIED